MNLKKYSGIIQNFTSLFIFKLIDAIIPLLIIPYLISVVGVDKYGVYAFSLALIFYLISVLQFGFSLSAVRKIANFRYDRDKLNSIFCDFQSTRLILTVGVLAILFILVSSIEIFNKHAIIYVFFSLMIIGEGLTPNWFFLGLEKMYYVTIINAFSKFTFLLLAFLLIKEETDYVYISLCYSIGYVFAGIISQIIIYKKFALRFKISSFNQIKITLKESWNSFLTLITPSIYNNVVIFLIGLYWPIRFSGVMEISVKVSGAFGMLNTVLTDSFYPYLNRNKDKIYLAKYVFIGLGIMLSLAMYFFSEYLILIWLGNDDTGFLEIIEAVKYLSPCPFLLSIISIFGINGLMVYKKDKIYSRIIVFGSMIGLIMAIILIPKYGYIGGAITIVAALSIKAILSSIFFIKTIKKL